MAFTREEFTAGVLLAWLLPLLALPVLVFTGLSMGSDCSEHIAAWCAITGATDRAVTTATVFGLGAAFSVPTLLLFILPAHALNKALERVAKPAAHVALNAFLGLAVGAAGAFAPLLIFGLIVFLPFATATVVGSAVAGSIGFALSWRITAARALRADAIRPAAPAKPPISRGADGATQGITTQMAPRYDPKFVALRQRPI